MRKYAIVVAAGSGSRMKSEIPKQFMLLHGKPLFTYAVQAFINAFEDIEILLVVPENTEYSRNELLQYIDNQQRVKIVQGGASRFESVKKALVYAEDNSIVFVHDAVRPFINNSFLKMLYEQTISKGNAVPCTELSDSIRLVNENENYAVPRQHYKAIQTPQVFKTEKLKQAYSEADHHLYTDDASVIESIGEKINLVEGLRENIKITYPIDVMLAEVVLSK